MAETKRRPWYAVALVAGFGGVLAVMASIGLAGQGARAEKPSLATAGVSMPAVQEAVTAEQLRNLTAQINTLQTQLTETIKQVGELNGRLSRVEGRLEK